MLLLAVVVSFSSTSHSELKGSTNQKLTTFMNKTASKKHFSGVVLVAKDGKTIFKKSYGMANIEAGVPNRTDTEFRIASLTKSFTAISILQLENEDKLKTTDSISKYINGFPDGNKITIHDLLTHSSGVVDHTKYTDPTKPITLSAFIDLMKKQKLKFPPGTKFDYSDTGYMMLAYIIEKVSGESYGNYLRDHIFIPAGMHHTFLREADARNMALGYENLKRTVMTEDESQLAGAGDIISTADDMLKYDNAIHSYKLLPPEKVEKMWTGYIDSAPYGIFKYGYAWNVADNLISFRRPLVEHNGNLPGFKSDLADFVNDRLTVIILSNNNGAWKSGALSRELASICFGKRYWFYQNYF
jgi:CubicO group peptidase (beta-lactamase class C family)